MARIRRKKSLYEVIGRSWPKPEAGRAGEQLPGEGAGEEKSAGLTWRKRPRIFQLNAGRVEISIPYQLAVAVVLGVMLLILVVFRLGQMSAMSEQAKGNWSIIDESGQVETGSEETAGTKNKPDVTEEAGEEGATHDNVIVVVEHSRHADLVPVQQHFLEYGIDTEIVQAPNGKYFLWTKERYEKTKTPGTRGYEVKQRIRQIGALYKGKAPEGYETFAPHYFSDAYGKKIK